MKNIFILFLVVGCSGCASQKINVSDLAFQDYAIDKGNMLEAQAAIMNSYVGEKAAEIPNIYYLVNDDNRINCLGSVTSESTAAFIDTDGVGYIYTPEANEQIQVFKKPAVADTPENTCRKLVSKFKSVISISNVCLQAMCRSVLCKWGDCGGESEFALNEFASLACAPPKLVTCNKHGVCCTDCNE